MKSALLLALLPAADFARAQDAPSEFLAELLKGVPVDSPRAMLYWGSGTHDSLTADPRMVRELQAHRRGV